MDFVSGTSLMTHCVVLTCPSSQQGGGQKERKEERLEVENTLWANTVLASGGCALQVVGPAGGCGLQVDVPCYM